MSTTTASPVTMARGHLIAATSRLVTPTSPRAALSGDALSPSDSILLENLWKNAPSVVQTPNRL
jgi:hypothetical protein